MKPGDEVIRIPNGRYKVELGKILNVIPGGYEVLMSDKSIIYVSRKQIELRYEDEAE